MDTDALMKLLAQIAEPPVKRLESIAQRLEETHTVTAETVAELKAIIAIMSDTGTGVNAVTATSLAYAAEVLPHVVGRVENAVNRMSQFM